MTDERRDPADDEVIRLRVPALVPYARVARLALTAIASRNGLGYDDVEDLRIAVGELFGVLVNPESVDDDLLFTCVIWSDAIDIVAEREPARAFADISELTVQILDAVVDEADLDATIGRIRISKHLASP